MIGDSLAGYFKHLPAVIVFFVISVFWSIHFNDNGVESIRTSDTTDVFYSIVMQNRDQRAEFQDKGVGLLIQIWNDQVSVWRDVPLAQQYQSHFDAYLKSVYLVTGDVALAYKMIVAPLNFIFLIGCYLLFVHLLKNRWLALLFSVLASFPVFIPLAGENFGMGPFVNFSRRHLFTAFVPVALYGFVRYRDGVYALVPVFVLFGVIANLHASGLLLIEIVLLTYMLMHARRYFAFAHAFMFLVVSCCAGFIALGDPWGDISGFVNKLVGIIVPAAYAATFDWKGGIDQTLQYLWYPPHIYQHLPEALVHLMSAGASIIALSPLFFRGHVSKPAYGLLLFLSPLSVLAFLGFSELKVWLLVGIAFWLASKEKNPSPATELISFFIVSTFIVGFLFSFVLQLLHILVPDFPVIFNNIRAVRFIGIFVFLWLAALLAQVDFESLNKTRRLGLILVLLFAVFFDLRHLVRDYRPQENREEIMSLMDVARWSKENTPTNARFFVASSQFGIISERAIYMTNKSTRTCLGCVNPTLSTDVDDLRKAARANGMDFALLRKTPSLAHVDSAVYENHYYALLRVAEPSSFGDAR